MKDIAKKLLDSDCPQIDELSSSSDSSNSVESDPDYRKRRELSFKYIDKLRRNTFRNTDPDIHSKLGKPF